MIRLGVPALAFADDIVAVPIGERLLARTIEATEAWAKANGMEINKDKSGIIMIRADRRTPKHKEAQIKGYPVVTEYKYLGVMIDDSV